MRPSDLPCERVLNGAFKEKGRAHVVKIDVFPVEDGDLVQLVFESAKSSWRQGVWLKTDQVVVVEQQRCPSVVLWQDTAPASVVIECRTGNGCLHVYNVWDRGRGMESQSWTSGMLVDDLPTGRRYHCNDIGFDTDFTKLVFRIERLAK